MSIFGVPNTIVPGYECLRYSIFIWEYIHPGNICLKRRNYNQFWAIIIWHIMEITLCTLLNCMYKPLDTAIVFIYNYYFDV